MYLELGHTSQELLVLQPQGSIVLLESQDRAHARLFHRTIQGRRWCGGTMWHDDYLLSRRNQGRERSSLCRTLALRVRHQTGRYHELQRFNHRATLARRRCDVLLSRRCRRSWRECARWLGCTQLNGGCRHSRRSVGTSTTSRGGQRRLRGCTGSSRDCRSTGSLFRLVHPMISSLIQNEVERVIVPWQ